MQHVIGFGFSPLWEFSIGFWDSKFIGESLIKPKLAFTIFSVLMALTGIVMLVFAERITQRIWPDAVAYALNIGVVLRYVMGATIISTACILSQCRKISEVESAKQVLFGAAAGLGFVFLTMLVMKFTGTFNMPPPPLVLTAVISILCLFAALKPKPGYGSPKNQAPHPANGA